MAGRQPLAPAGAAAAVADGDLDAAAEDDLRELGRGLIRRLAGDGGLGHAPTTPLPLASLPDEARASEEPTSYPAGSATRDRRASKPVTTEPAGDASAPPRATPYLAPKR